MYSESSKGAAMAANGPENLSTSELLIMCRDIFSQFENNDELKKIEGLLRVAGSKADTDEIMDSCVIPEIEKANVHTILDVVKRILPVLHDRVANASPEAVQALQLVSFNLSTDDDSTIQKTVNALSDCITQMVEEGGESEQLAEILYSYIHFGYLLTEHSDVNKMTSNNCAIVIGPKVNDILGLVDQSTMDPLEAVAKIGLANAVVDLAISSGAFAFPFSEQYFIQLQTAREAKFEEAANQVDNASQSLSRVAEKIKQTNEAIAMTQTLLDRLIEQKSLNKSGLFHKKTSQEKEHDVVLKKMISQTAEKLQSLHEKLETLEPIMLNLAKQKSIFASARLQLQSSMDRIQRYKSDSDSDISLSSDESSPRSRYDAGPSSMYSAHIEASQSSDELDIIAQDLDDASDKKSKRKSSLNK